jgi:hypothetical protein
MDKYKSVSSFNVPILFIIYKRRNSALKVMDVISKIKPKKLYISQDGPRNTGNALLIDEVRKAVLAKVNWNCKLTVWVHEKNFGLKEHIPEAFNKFFKKEEYGIYLEDDTLPSEDFFYYEQKLLEKYKNDGRIFSINATNYYSDKLKSKYSYYLSQIGDIWGFGLWRRSWKLYNSFLYDFDRTSKTMKYKKYFFSKGYKFYLESFWKAIKNKRLDSWAMQLVYAAIKNDMYFISPTVNMVNNIGVGNNASNPSLQKYLAKFASPFPLKHPVKLMYDKRLDSIYFRNMLRGGWLRLILIKIYLYMPFFLRNIINLIVSNTI